MNKSLSHNPGIGQAMTDIPSMPLSSSLDSNLAVLKETFDDCDDIVFNEAQVADKSVCLVYFAELVSHQSIFDIEKRLSSFTESYTQTGSQASFTSLVYRYFPFRSGDESKDLSFVIKNILAGQIILLVDELDDVLIFQSHKSDERVPESDTEQTVRGPHKGFVENIHTNLQLIRQKIQTPSLKVEYFTLGKQSNTKISVVFMKGIADEAIVEEVHSRLSRIDIDGVLDSHYIESMIKDSPRSPFPTLFSTERPDRVCGGLLDGKVAILTDGTPTALTAPAMFVEFLHSSEDYYDSSLIASAIRWVRFLGLFVALILPAFFVGITAFHQDLLQTPFLMRIAASREALPYPVVVEGVFMLLTYELLREAGLRMPKKFGGAVVTILGLVLIGQSAVQAGLIGPMMAIVVSVSALTSFILPNYEFHQVIRFCTIPFLLLAGLFGFMGILVGLMFALTHLVSIRSFGVPYFSPVSPARKEGWKDVFIRAPWRAMDTRTPGLGIDNIDRSGARNMANPPKEDKVDQDDKE
ncbi:spore germination protein [Lentibacillus salinarum]|uniref:Spore germination protein n=1 Tax=Lentibacillus salinarum TaxID=446820 RepID=A0ABW3ZRR2_9BACI